MKTVSGVSHLKNLKILSSSNEDFRPRASLPLPHPLPWQRGLLSRAAPGSPRAALSRRGGMMIATRAPASVIYEGVAAGGHDVLVVVGNPVTIYFQKGVDTTAPPVYYGYIGPDARHPIHTTLKGTVMVQAQTKRNATVSSVIVDGILTITVMGEGTLILDPKALHPNVLAY